MSKSRKYFFTLLFLGSGPLLWILPPDYFATGSKPYSSEHHFWPDKDLAICHKSNKMEQKSNRTQLNMYFRNNDLSYPYFFVLHFELHEKIVPLQS